MQVNLVIYTLFQHSLLFFDAPKFERKKCWRGELCVDV